MAELIALIILMGSLLGIGVIIFRKIPVLAELPETSDKFGLKARVAEIKEKIKSSRFKLPSFEIFLQKVLSKIRILTLKAESKTGSWLGKLRERSQKKKENDNYWEELKKSTKSKGQKNNLKI